MHATKGEVVLARLGGQIDRAAIVVGHDTDGNVHLMVFGEGGTIPTEVPGKEGEAPKLVDKPEPNTRIMRSIGHKSERRTNLFPYWEHRRIS